MARALPPIKLPERPARNRGGEVRSSACDGARPLARGAGGGPGGGWALVVPAGRITLRDVYRAVEHDPLFPLHAGTPSPRCPVGRTIQAALAGRYEEVQLALERDLARTTVAELLQEVRTLERRS